MAIFADGYQNRAEVRFWYLYQWIPTRLYISMETLELHYSRFRLNDDEAPLNPEQSRLNLDGPGPYVVPT